MKKLFLLFAIACPLLFSCSNDDNVNVEVVEEEQNEPHTPCPYHTFDEPCIQWGLTMDEVKELMRADSLLSSNEAVLTYAGKDKVNSVTYSFDHNSLYYTRVKLYDSMLEKGELRAFLEDKYKMLECDEDDNYMILTTHHDSISIIANRSEEISGTFYYVSYFTR